MAHQQSSGSQGFGRQPRQGYSSIAGSERSQESNVPAHLVPERSGHGLRLGARPQLGSQSPRGLPPPARSGVSGAMSWSRSPGSGAPSPPARSGVSGAMSWSRSPGPGAPSDMERSLDHNVNMRATSHASGYTFNRMPSSVGPVSSHRGGRLQEQRSRPKTFHQGSDSTVSDNDANKKKRSGESPQKRTFVGPWMTAFKKRQNNAAVIDSTQASVQGRRQSDVVMSEVEATIRATSPGLPDIPATAPTPMPETEGVAEEPITCLESQDQTSIESASITATPHVDTSMVNASDVDTPDQAAEVDVMLETPSTPEHRCSLPWDCEINECVQR